MELFTKTSTTSIIAVMLIAFSFFLIGYIAIQYGNDATTRTQIITGLLTSIAAVTGYYFGSAKQRNPSITADTVTNLNTGNQSPDQSATDNSPTT